ncbi:hypothetical protein C1J01_14195 [Nonomuraea aridisoli]|uniref:Ester cyclase n=1 Tax=Nonomuraea aridisoli TaxID=2070368 RepID=A0A2W2E437_9ACTN|nr:hypothetical protein C1J01_14195 [Nonomuraea aridisoli]
MPPQVASFDARRVGHGLFSAMRDGDLDDCARYVHPEAANREALREPLACRERGPAGTYATARMLRAIFTGLSWEVHQIVSEGDLLVAHVTMTGRHVRTMYSYDDQARVTVAFPPTGRSFAVTQTHWCRIRDGKVIDHWANRDDMGMARQLGWIPPSAPYLVRMALALRSARRAEARRGGPIPAGHHERPATHH